MSKLVDAEGSLNLHGTSRGDPAAIWGLLRERQGAEALQGFRGKLPERYQKLLEQYYRGLSRGGPAPPAPPVPPAPPAGGAAEDGR